MSNEPNLTDADLDELLRLDAAGQLYAKDAVPAVPRLFVEGDPWAKMRHTPRWDAQMLCAAACWRLNEGACFLAYPSPHREYQLAWTSTIRAIARSRRIK